jgi:hypothetical protein
MKIQVAVFWVVTPYSDVVKIPLFRRTMLLDEDFALKTETAGSYETLVPYHNITGCHNPARPRLE